MSRKIHSLARALGLLVMAAFAGCESFYLSQSERFIDEDGNVISVDYGKIDEDYVSTFKTPNGNEHEYKSRFSVRVRLADGTTFKAYQVFNELMSGALYRSDNEKWTYHAKGNTCTVYKRVEEKLYEPVFMGVVCKGTARHQEEQRR